MPAPLLAAVPQYHLDSQLETPRGFGLWAFVRTGDEPLPACPEMPTNVGWLVLERPRLVDKPAMATADSDSTATNDIRLATIWTYSAIKGPVQKGAGHD